MQILINAVLPIFSLIILGYILRKYLLKDDDFWSKLDFLTYYVFMPSMLFYKISKANLSGTDDAFLSVFIVLGVLGILSILAVILNLFIKMKGDKFTSFYQGAIRYNTYIYLAIVQSLYGENGIVIAAFLISFAIPVINVLCVSAFAFYVRDGKFNPTRTIKQILTNPLIIACLLGGLANYLQLNISFFQIFALLGNAAITLGLISIGAGLSFKAIKTLKSDFYFSSFFKLILFPIITFALCNLFALDPFFTSICILFSAMPTATSSYILAKQLGGDTNLMSVIITLQTLICPVSIWLALIFLK